MVPSSKPLERSAWTVPIGLALLKLCVHVPLLGRYGYHHDELYFLACGRHLDFGYVDHAPLVPWLARLADALFGQSLFGLRIASTLAGAAAVFLTSTLARRFGGGSFAELLSGVAMIVASAFLRMHNVLCIPAFEPLFWLLGSHLLVRIVDEDAPRLWPWMGVVVGLGLLNKHSMLFFCFGLGVALVATPARKHLASPWLYLGAFIAGVLFSPNVIWQAEHGFPTVVFLENLNADVMRRITTPEFLLGQVFYLNPVTAPLWMAGLVFFFRSPGGRKYRALGWIYVAVFGLLVVVKAKIYYLAPAYPALFAGGAVLFEERVRAGARWLRPVAVGVLVLGGAALAPLSLPILSIDATERYVTAATFGAFGDAQELTADLRGQFGWHERVAAVATAYRSLTPSDRANAVVWGGSYGVAGAIDYFGAPYGLPKAVSGHMTYFLWGLPEHPIDVAVAIGVPREDLDKVFYEVTIAVEIDLKDVSPRDRHLSVAVCRKPTVDLHRAWPAFRRWSNRAIAVPGPRAGAQALSAAAGRTG